jgi:hypothetical protein
MPTRIGRGSCTAGSGFPHGVDLTFQWSSTGTDPDGGAFTSFLGELYKCTSVDGSSVTGGFASHCDWRLPSIVELQTILLAPFRCGTRPCIDPIFGPTAAGIYWSSSTVVRSPANAWGVSFANGEPLERHHIILNENDPARDDPRNMRLMHRNCHQQIHHNNHLSVAGILLRTT